ncbi:MAG TPA: methyltransferase domain-containing protein [Acidobacteriaceae bacterium]
MPDRIDFSQRVDIPEYMDGPCSYEDLRRCLQDLAVVNRITRAHLPILEFLEEQVQSKPPRPLRVVDFGCGYGDMLRRIERWAAGRGVVLDLVGVDVNQNAIRAAREATPASSRIVWIHGDVYAGAGGDKADVIAVSGVLHHLAEPEIVRFLRWADQTARLGWVAVDLHRMPVPYRIFNLLMRGPWWHPFIHYDGLASIRRAFLVEDWQRMCAAAGLCAEDVAIRHHRPARLCVERRKAAHAQRT